MSEQRTIEQCGHHIPQASCPACESNVNELRTSNPLAARLEAWDIDKPNCEPAGLLLGEACDEIERLTAELGTMRAERNAWMSHHLYYHRDCRESFWAPRAADETDDGHRGQ